MAKIGPSLIFSGQANKFLQFLSMCLVKHADLHSDTLPLSYKTGYDVLFSTLLLFYISQKS